MSPNEGTTFEVYLPEIKSEETGVEPAVRMPLQFGNERILFVDDEQIIVDMLVSALTRVGYKVVPMTSSIDALELFRKDPFGFDLVISDMTMPGMTGDNLAQALISIRHDIPILLCTGYSEHISEKQAKALGIREFLFKPVDMRTLTEAIRKVLDKG